MLQPLPVAALAAVLGLSHSQPQAVATVLVYDESALQPADAAKMAATAAEVLGRAGVRTVWVLCAATPSACPEQVVPTHLLLRLVLKPPRDRPALTDAFGVCTTWERGAYATVFVTPVFELAKRIDVRPGRLLGYVAAHEIGHVLLGPAHSRSGVMRQNWAAADFLGTTRGWLTFLPEQAERMRREIRSRASLADAQGASAVTRHR